MELSVVDGCLRVSLIQHKVMRRGDLWLPLANTPWIAILYVILHYPSMNLV